MDHSATFGPTDSAAGTKTTVGTAKTQLSDKNITIHRLRVGKGNVVNAKECSGFITVEAVGLEGSHVYAYGNGSGGATNNGQNGPSEEIECSIPIGAGVDVTVEVLDAEAAKDVTVSLGFDKGQGKNVYSYGLGGAGVDTTADTLLAGGMLDKKTGKTTVVGVSGRIKEIRFAGTGVVDADAGTGKLVFEMPIIKGPWEYAIGNGPGGATLGGPNHADVFNVDIPVKANDSVVVNLTTAEIMLSATCSFQVA